MRNRSLIFIAVKGKSSQTATVEGFRGCIGQCEHNLHGYESHAHMTDIAIYLPHILYYKTS